MKKIVAKDIAKITGYSPAAVTRAFKKGAPISPEMRAEILRVSKELGYMPPSARSVADLSAGTITLVTGNLQNPFYPAVSAAFSQAFQQQGKRLVLHSTPPDHDVDAVMEQVLDYRPEATIVTSTRMSSKIAAACRANDMPVILFNRVQPDLGMMAVTCDNYGGGRLAAERLIARGRRRIALLGGLADTSTHLERVAGFKDRLRESGIALQNTLCGHYSFGPSFEAVTELLRGPQPVDALFCLNDIMAISAINAAHRIGARIPDDLAVIGFDDIPMASWPIYDLTTIQQPIDLMVKETLDLIDTTTRDPSGRGDIRVTPAKLVERGSA